MNQLDLESLRSALAGTAAAFRCVTEYQPAGGPGDKVFPATYEGGKYATEDRVDPATGNTTRCVLLDSVQSQANRMELALLEAHRAGKVRLPLMVVRFDDERLLRKFSVTSLEAPHRAADALFRDSLLDGVIFRQSRKGRILDTAGIGNATGLFGLCPTGLVFGLWDSTGPRGGLGAKFQRALVSEIVGYDAVPGTNTASRLDPAQIQRGAATIYRRKDPRQDEPRWTLNKAKGSGKLGKGSNSGRPSQANHGNVTPDYAFAKDAKGQIVDDTVMDEGGRERKEPRVLGGFTISKAVQTTVLSLSVLRRLRFPASGASDSDHRTDVAARTVLAALGLAAGTLARNDTDLRSRCQLFPEGRSVWQLLDHPGRSPREFALDPDMAVSVLQEALGEARKVGLPWDGEIELTPSDDLLELVLRSQQLASETTEHG